jgi:hypothetical protein
MIGNYCIGFRCAERRPSRALPGPMKGVCTVLASTAAVLLLAGCGPSTNTPAPGRIATKPDVIVTMDGARHACVVALNSETQGSTISCDDVVPFLRDELRVPSGSIYDVRTLPGVDKAALAKVDTSLRDAGYRFIGGPR